MTYFKPPEPQINVQKKVQLPGKISVWLVALFFGFFHCAYQWILLVGHKSYLKLAWGLLINGKIKTYIINNISAKQEYNLHKHMNIYTTAINNTYLCKTSTCNWNFKINYKQFL